MKVFEIFPTIFCKSDNLQKIEIRLGKSRKSEICQPVENILIEPEQIGGKNFEIKSEVDEKFSSNKITDEIGCEKFFQSLFI